jgi:hypothetical protein
MLIGNARKSIILFILSVISLVGCSSKKIVGTYILCGFNCQTLVLDDEQSFTETNTPEIGDKQEIKGYFEYDGKLLTLYPNQIDEYVDGIKISTDSSIISHYKPKWNRLVEQTNPNQSYKKCDYTKLSEKPKKAKRIVKRNKLRCTTHNPVRRLYYWIRY